VRSTLRIVLGNQLFPIERMPCARDVVVFMAEDVSLCTYVRHHKQKLVLFLAAMRNYADELKRAGYEVCYHRLESDDSRSYEDKLTATVQKFGCTRAATFEVEDRFMETRLASWADAHSVDLSIEQSPMFLCSRDRFSAFAAGKEHLSMADFYKAERQRLRILIESDGSPTGKQWSFDKDNRKRLPKKIKLPELPALKNQAHVSDVEALVEERFADHPGTSGPCWLPVSRKVAQVWLEDFVAQRLPQFGPYEDALTQRSRSVFHSVLSSSLNLGLLMPDEVVARVLDAATKENLPLNSVEGFVRQVIGWREFVRGVYRVRGDEQSSTNYWGHRRRPAATWYSGETGIPPLDQAIRTAWQYGWDHHIPRLMVVGNLMTLSEIAPAEAWNWFMEMYVDSSDWVMGPNVYGMALFSDGGIFATKPYICGSNYLLKMSDHERGSWCDVVDGLYWRFIAAHRDFFESNHRLSMMPRMLDKLDESRRSRIFAAAEGFLDMHTVLD
jgi:deoxyribodipyrimidine photolyase-related protein